MPTLCNINIMQASNLVDKHKSEIQELKSKLNDTESDCDEKERKIKQLEHQINELESKFTHKNTRLHTHNYYGLIVHAASRTKCNEFCLYFPPFYSISICIRNYMHDCT